MQLTRRRKANLNGGEFSGPGFQPCCCLRIEWPVWLEMPHWNVGHSREVRWQFSFVVTAKCNPAPSQHRGQVTVLEQHVRPGRSDPMLTNYRIIIRCRKENSTSNSTCKVLYTRKVTSPSLKHSVHN